MDGGLDELIESLLTEIAFSGTRGCSVNLLVDKICKHDQSNSDNDVATNERQASDTAPNTITANEAPKPSSEDNESENDQSRASGFASKVWSWLVARNDVSVGLEGEFDSLSLNELLLLPEHPSEVVQGSTTKTKAGREQPVSQYRPCVFLSDEQQWRLVAGHGPDLKRVPKFEYLAMVDIASTREEGIMQGDLVRLTGQDKRSLPMRTDALAAKGYIIKQSVLFRGCRSSKLWLAKFADSAAEDAKREGLPFDVDLSREALTQDLDPVPFSNLWTSDHVDYIAIAQAFLAVSKAWGTIRYCDLRTKLGMEQLTNQMRALAKTSRFFVGLGVIRFVAARFSHSSRIFKDCVRFIREPTTQEWKEFRAVPRNRIAAPSQRLGKRGEAYRANLATPTSKKTDSKSKKKKKVKDAEDEDMTQAKPAPRLQDADFEMMNKIELGPVSRMLTKPFPNTIYEIIKRAGDAGSSNTEMAQLTFGHGYKKMIAAVSRSISTPPKNPSSEPFRVISHKHRVGRVDAYRFFSTGLSGDEMADQDTSIPGDFGYEAAADKRTPSAAYEFTEASSSSFKKRGPVTLSQLAQISDNRRKLGRKKSKFSKLNVVGDLATEPPISSQPEETTIEIATQTPLSPVSQTVELQTSQVLEKRKRGRPPKAEKTADKPPTPSGQQPSSQEQAEVMDDVVPNDEIIVQASPSPPPPIVPGALRGKANSLDPPGRKGRPKKSYVLVMRSSRLRDPAFLGETDANATKFHAIIERDDHASEASAGRIQFSSINKPTVTDMASGEAKKEAVSAGPATQADSDENDEEARLRPYKCGKCGKRWKNDNGLDYHQKVAKTSCNPNYTPMIREPPPPSRPRVQLPPPPPPPPAVAPVSPETVEKEPATMPKRARERKHKVRQPYRAIGTAASPWVTQTDSSQPSFLPEYQKASSALLQALPVRNVGGCTSIFGDDQSAVSPELPSRNDQPSAVDDDRVSGHLPDMETQEDYPAGDYAPLPPPGSLEQYWAEKVAGEVQPDHYDNSSHNMQGISELKRSDRLRTTIDFLLHHNDGVFPGDQSLLAVLTGLWKRGYSDQPKPDDKIVRRVVNKMERDGELAQSFFSFFDDQSQVQNISVVVIPDLVGSVADAAKHPMVIEVKDAMKKVFPAPYFPPAVNFLDQGAGSHGFSQSSTPQVAGCDDPTEVGPEDVEILQYAMPIMTTTSTPLPSDKVSKGKKRASIVDTPSGPRKRTKMLPPAESLRDPAPRTLESPPQPRRGRKSAAPDNTSAESTQTAADDAAYIDPALQNISSQDVPAAGNGETGFLTPKIRKKPGPKPGSKRKSGKVLDAGLATGSPLASANDNLLDPRLTQDAQPRLIGKPADISAAYRSEQDAVVDWIHDHDLPKSLSRGLSLANNRVELADLDDNDRGDFERTVDVVQYWEVNGDYHREQNGLLEPIFMNHTVASVPDNVLATPLRWFRRKQLNNMLEPIERDEFHWEEDTAMETLDGSRFLDDLGPAMKRVRRTSTTAAMQPGPPRATRKSKVLPKKPAPREYTTRPLTSFPPAHQGRTHKRRLSTDRMGLRGETDIISAFIIFKVLGGGVERASDYGMVLKLFPEMSLSGLRRFWGRVSKERKVHIAALFKAFPKAFLAAYERGELAPLDYDHFEDYDWLALVKWTSKLRLYDDIELPEERADFDEEYALEEPADQVPDWREAWFSVTSLFNRIDINAGKAASMPCSDIQIFDDELLLRARSYIRSLTRTQIRGTSTADRVRTRLLELCQGDEYSTNQLLELVLGQLSDEKFATRTKGKHMSQALRLNANFIRIFERNAHVEKFAQAMLFKEKLDATFREGKPFKLSYGADDGSTLAMFNLQASGRIQVQQSGFRHIPMGHEPGNYEGRKFPKSYYHFQITMTPTEEYVYNEDMPDLHRTVLADIPREGPRGEVPVWTNLFNEVDQQLWIEYLCTFVFAAATRGPVTAQSMCTIFKPTFELFEAQMLLDFCDRLGLLRRLMDSGDGVTVGEWWWLVIGGMLTEEQKAKAAAAAAAPAAPAAVN